MTTEIEPTENGVIVRYSDGNGNSAEAVVVGESLASVENRANEIVETHDLKEKATESD